MVRSRFIQSVLRKVAREIASPVDDPVDGVRNDAYIVPYVL